MDREVLVEAELGAVVDLLAHPALDQQAADVAVHLAAPLAARLREPPNLQILLRVELVGTEAPGAAVRVQAPPDLVNGGFAALFRRRAVRHRRHMGS